MNRHQVQPDAPAHDASGRWVPTTAIAKTDCWDTWDVRPGIPVHILLFLGCPGHLIEQQLLHPPVVHIGNN